MANNLGTRLSAMTGVDEILDAVVDELHRAFGYYICHVVRLRDGGVVRSLVGRGEMYGQMAEIRLGAAGQRRASSAAACASAT